MDAIVTADIKVSLDSLSYSWGRKREKAYVYMSGHIYRQGIDCTFKLEINRQGHHLSFPKDVTQDKEEDLNSLALSVKNALLQFLKESPEVPEAHRQKLCDCVLNHHLQKRQIK
jgi:hypothetical protein